MQRCVPCACVLGGLLIVVAACLADRASSAEPVAPTLQFEVQEIDRSLKVGYAVLLADVNGDQRLDIVVVDTQRVIWFENPNWKMHYILRGGTKPDNVCIAAHDIDGDGRLDFALGADWRPFRHPFWRNLAMVAANRIALPAF